MVGFLLALCQNFCLGVMVGGSNQIAFCPKPFDLRCQQPQGARASKERPFASPPSLGAGFNLQIVLKTM